MRGGRAETTPKARGVGREGERWVEILRRRRKVGRMSKRLMAVLVMAVLTTAARPAVPESREPRNLGLLKREIRVYVESGAYDREVAAVAQAAAEWIGARAAQRKPGERLAVVLDLDDTLWSGWQDMAGFDFGWNGATWAAWVEAAKAPPIGPVREVYRLARRLGVEVFFVTTRTERERKSTEQNLAAIGCRECAALIMQPTGDPRTAAAFKTGERRRLVAEGWVIVANLGDQASDLAGGLAEKAFKLPNPFYLTE
jgi:acid phosphatase